MHVWVTLGNERTMPSTFGRIAIRQIIPVGYSPASLAAIPSRRAGEEKEAGSDTARQVIPPSLSAVDLNPRSLLPRISRGWEANLHTEAWLNTTLALQLIGANGVVEWRGGNVVQ